MVTAGPHPALRRFWIEASGAGHALGQIRKFAERWTSLFRSYSDLLILNEEDWLRSLTEFLDIDERLSEVLSKTVTEAGARSIDARQKVGGEPERVWRRNRPRPNHYRTGEKQPGRRFAP